MTTRVARVSTTPRAGARARNRRGEGGLLRDEIVAAAAVILAEAGTEEAVTLRAVARQAGISAPSIYSHFPHRQAILLAVVKDAFTDLARHLHESLGDRTEPTARLLAVCDGYLDFAASSPHRYRVMFGGVWNASAAMASASVSPDDVGELGQDTLGLIAACLRRCVEAGGSTSTDVEADAVALWLGLHGLAHQRTASAAFPWPGDIQQRIVVPLAHLVHERARRD
jgi:AcrR family transcriptional regulator